MLRVDRRRLRSVTVPLQDFFGGDVSAAAEERGVVEDHGQVFRDLHGVSVVCFDQMDRVHASYLTHALVALDQTVYGLDRQETVVHRHRVLAAMQHVRCDDSRKIVNVHLASTLLVYMRER